jgi:CRISPR-associated protein Cmr2
LKRLGPEVDGIDVHRVFSISHIASWSLRRCFDENPALVPECERAFQEYERVLLDEQLSAELSRTPARTAVLGWRDGHILYDSRLRDLFPPRSKPKVDRAKDAHRTLFSAWRRIALEHGVELPPLTRYYALLSADGDRVGKALDDLKGRTRLDEVTRALEGFAAEARREVEAHHGQCIYAGGDDVLAMLPVTTALRCAKALRKAFAPVGRTFAEAGVRGPTLSVGIAISHHMRPLQHALDAVRAVEKQAKVRHQRDAWAIQFDKRGGVPIDDGGKWNELERLQLLVDGFANWGVTRGLPYELREIARRVPGDALGPIRRSELHRILAQKDLDRRLFDEMLDERSDLAALADRLLIARALSGTEVDHG